MTSKRVASPPHGTRRRSVSSEMPSLGILEKSTARVCDVQGRCTACREDWGRRNKNKWKKKRIIYALRRWRRLRHGAVMDGRHQFSVYTAHRSCSAHIIHVRNIINYYIIYIYHPFGCRLRGVRIRRAYIVRLNVNRTPQPLFFLHKIKKPGSFASLSTPLRVNASAVWFIFNLNKRRHQSWGPSLRTYIIYIYV